ncbi:helix-turn-helix domain-containing protein [Halopiger djelfimassiliensis]|uniref:helix-turn-helix domain-containing protein n=1 Tax=Halopiger djelfimassiliensis TaxID=1293047 RepID=UPI00067833D1|nr:helix-turn-helix domain-containing protein [Halopiger djelfimassiliensis]
MRYATVVLTWADGRVNTIDDTFARSDAVAIDAVRYLSPVHEGRFVELFELRGDLEHARALLADSAETIEYDVAGADGRGLAYVQCRSIGPVSELLAILQEHDIVLDWPMEFVDTGPAVDGDADRGLEVTALGTSRAIKRAAAALPAGVDLELRRLGEYEPATAHELTERQREIFQLAHSEGYYDVPRGTTHRELATTLGLSPATVGEHLQRIEAKLAASYASSNR